MAEEEDTRHAVRWTNAYRFIVAAGLPHANQPLPGPPLNMGVRGPITAYRCLVPVTSFCEYLGDQPKVPHWFALTPHRPPFAFAGIWRPWTGPRGKEDGDHLLFSILTTDANAIMQPIHLSAMPVILSGDDMETWLTAPREIALQLQHPAPEDSLSIVAVGRRKDATPEELLTS